MNAGVLEDARPSIKEFLIFDRMNGIDRIFYLLRFPPPDPGQNPDDSVDPV